jgi:PAS domain S-box-containing protein
MPARRHLTWPSMSASSRRREQPSSLQNLLADPPSELAKATVLVVDDDPRNLYAMERVLGEFGHDVAAARSGEDALRQLLERDFAVILLDVQMPDLDGYETAELIRSRQRCRHVPIIFVTAFHKDDQHVFRGYSAGAVDYIFKPIDPMILTSKVAVFVELYRKAEAIKRQAALEKALLLENFRVRAEKLRTDEALRRREEQYALIIRSLPIALYTAAPADASRRRRFISDNISAVSGFSAARFVDADFWPSRIHDDDRARVLAEFGALGAADSVVTEYRWRTGDGGERYFLDHAVLVADRRGRGGEIFGTWLDITDRKQLEAQLQRTQRLEAIGRLTGGIAHDFNNMLAVVIGNLDMIAVSAEGSAATERYSAQALKGALRCADLTRHLLTFARQQPLEAKVFDLGAFVSGMTELLARTLGNNITVDYRAAAGLAPIAADPAHVEAALLNVVFNAPDAMPHGGTITIALSNIDWAEDDKQRPEDCLPGRYVMLNVVDTGNGMAPAVAARAFEPFFTTKGVGQGTGLGLSTTYGFLKQSGGHAALDSAPDRGTTITLFFPAARDAPATAAAPDRRAAEKPLRLARDSTVLIVEDEGDVRSIAVATLREFGLTVLEAADAATALDLLGARPEVRLLFTDVMMPGMSGTTLAAEALKQRPDIKVLYATGCDGYVSNELAATELLRKPYRAHELARRISAVLDGG